MLSSQQSPLHNLPSPYYRVATRAVILDDRQQILVAQNHDGNYELPGGGWEFDESFDISLSREIEEELGVEVAHIDPRVIGVYRGRNDYGMTLRVAVRVRLKSYDFKPVDMAAVRFVSKAEFLDLDFKPTADKGMKDCADVIWLNDRKIGV